MVISQASGNAGLNPGIYTSSTRPASPADGLVISETDTDSLSVYKGSAWAPVSGLTFISSATFSVASTVSLPANSFSATYQQYKIVLNLTATTNASSLSLRMRASGTDYSGAQYHRGVANINSSGTIDSSGPSGASGTSWNLAYNGSVDPSVGEVTLFSPNEAVNTYYISSFSGVNSNSTAVAVSYGGGKVYQTTQYDSATFLVSAGTMSGTYRLYGLANS